MNYKLPLHGLRVIDLTKVLSGPYATLLLCDLGAEIIKVEDPNGDDSRGFGPFINQKSGYFISLNRGKKSISLDLKKRKDKDIFSTFIQKSDVLVENYKPKTLKKLGFTWKKLSKINPRLIYAKISGFGENGPLSDLPAYDMVVQAMGGLMSITGKSENELCRVGTSIGDIVAGLFCVNGILSSLYNREKTGIGKKIDISMLDCQVAILENAIARYSILKKNPTPLGTDHPSISPFGAFKTKDEDIIIAAGSDSIFKKLCIAINRDDIFKNKRFVNNLLRNKNMRVLRDELEKTLKQKKLKSWLRCLTKNGIPCSAVNKINEVIKNPQVIHRDMILDYKVSNSVKIKTTGNPIKISGIKQEKKARMAPEFDGDRQEILKEFGIEI